MMERFWCKLQNVHYVPTNYNFELNYLFKKQKNKQQQQKKSQAAVITTKIDTYRL